MAGIGFELRRIIEDDSNLMSRIRGYASAGLIAAGPWLMTITTLSLISVMAPLFSDRLDYERFRAMVTYGFAFSLIAFGIVQMSFTRWVADLLYSKKFSRILPAFATACTWVAGVQLVIGSLCCVLAKMRFELAVAATLLYVIISLTWLSLVWLSATKDFNAVLWAFAKGCLLSVFGVLFFGFDVFQIGGTFFGTSAGLMAGYAIGQGLTLALLVRSIVTEMDLGGPPDRSILRSLVVYRRLALIGLFYNAGTWADQIVIWASDGVSVNAFVRFHPTYDTCRFFAYVTVIPAMAVNLVRVETTFFEHYRTFYGGILQGFPLEEIDRRKAEMLEALRVGTVRILRTQGAITLLVIVMAPQIVQWLSLPPSSVNVFRACCAGAFFHVLLLITLLILMYFDLRAASVLVTAVFFVGNVGLALLTLGRPHLYGMGYCAISFLALVLANGLLGRSVGKLEFYAFANQPAPVTLEPDRVALEPEAATT